MTSPFAFVFAKNPLIDTRVYVGDYEAPLPAEVLYFPKTTPAFLLLAANTPLLPPDVLTASIFSLDVVFFFKLVSKSGLC